MLVVFDLDNTLVARTAAVRAWATEFVVTHGLDHDRVEWLMELDQDGYADRTTMFARVADELGVGTPEELLDQYRPRALELLEPMPGATGCLTQLRAAGHRLVIVSNGSAAAQHAKVDRLGLREMVDAVVVSGSVGVSKPEAKIFRIAAEAVGELSERWWMVGDAPVNDIDGARRLGAHTAWITRGRRWDPSLPSPDVSVDHLDELVAAMGAVR